MHILRHAPGVSDFIQSYPDHTITALVKQRLNDLLQDDDLTMEEILFFVIPEPGESIQQLEQALGTDLLTTDGYPLWEVLEAHPTCYELVIVLSDDGFGAEVLIPKASGIDPDLLALCQRHATPAAEGIDR